MKAEVCDLDYTDRRGFVERCHGRRIPIMRRFVGSEVKVERSLDDINLGLGVRGGVGGSFSLDAVAAAIDR